MPIHPPVQVKALTEVSAGELVRIDGGETSLLALMSYDDQPTPDRILVYLQWDHDEAVAPLYVNVADARDDECVLSYGRAFEFCLDTSRDLDVGGRRLWEKNGTILLKGSRAYLRFGPHPRVPRRRHLLNYDIATGMFSSGLSGPGIALIARWSIKLTEYHPPHPLAQPLLSFFANDQ